MVQLLKHCPFSRSRRHVRAAPSMRASCSVSPCGPRRMPPGRGRILFRLRRSSGLLAGFRFDMPRWVPGRTLGVLRGLQIMPALLGLWCVAGFLAIAAVAVAVGRTAFASALVYGASLLISLIGLGSALFQLVFSHAPDTLTLPLGLPGLGAHFRVDALTAFFLIVANLGGAAASLYAVGYGRHEHAPMRVLPYYPAYLAGMNLVVLANDAFSFLIAWEFMSLTSWALVMANHRAPE